MIHSLIRSGTRLNSSFTKCAMQLLFSQPLLSTTAAHLISLVLGTTYVGSLYLSKNARLSFVSKPADIPQGYGNIPREKLKDERWRDDPDVIRARIFAVSVATILCCLAVFVVLWLQIGGKWKVICLQIIDCCTLIPRLTKESRHCLRRNSPSSWRRSSFSFPIFS